MSVGSGGETGRGNGKGKGKEWGRYAVGSKLFVGKRGGGRKRNKKVRMC